MNEYGRGAEAVADNTAAAAALVADVLKKSIRRSWTISSKRHTTAR